MIVSLVAIYNINVTKNLLYPLPKHLWKIEVKRTVKQTWSTNLKRGSANKKSMEWYIAGTDTGQIHPSWTPCVGNPRYIAAAITRARMLVGRFKTAPLAAKYTGSSDKI